MDLVIVESPAKAKTIKKYLGKDFEVMASYGHVRDLPAKQGAINPDADFSHDDYEPTYQIIEKNAKHIDALTSAAKKAKKLYLATDPDREGEAISWHIYKTLLERKIFDKSKSIHRVVFHQITQGAIRDAMEHPRDISMDLVNAQQARRALDYLVGFNLSPLLWKKIRRGLSAGRVQSPALRMIVEREEEIEAFVAQEYWTIEADLIAKKQNFIAKLIEYQGEKLSQFSITNSEQAQSITNALIKSSAGALTVNKVEKKQRKRNPPPPFITSTLQQEAARKLGFTAQRTMRTAQQLYEGIDVGDGAVGLITYMRTDSVNLAAEAIIDIRQVVQNLFGSENLPKEARIFKSKVKNAQEAHEAIRPTSAENMPTKLKGKLTPDQYKLYELIWKRTLACQMNHATIDTMSVDLTCQENNRFRATGSVIVDPGFLTLYQEGLDHAKASSSEDFKLPLLKVGEKVKLVAIRPEQHFTEPPPRYTEASLIKALEDHGIGRPSTYASIISTLQNREYVLLEEKRFKPTDVGRIVNKFLTQHFTQYVDYDFTAHLEDELDEISRGEKAWVPMMRVFWKAFKHQIDDIEEKVQRKDVTHEMIAEKCPKCGSPLSIRLGRRGRFIGCTAYPKCDYARSLGDDKSDNTPEIIEGRTCPDCAAPLQIRFGRYGKFIGCTQYPKCKYHETLQKPNDTGIECPQCHQGSLLKRRSHKGKFFYSCSRYPECDYAIWNEPINESCPTCQWPILTLKTTKRKGTEKVCPRKTCDFAAPYESKEKKEKTSLKEKSK